MAGNADSGRRGEFWRMAPWAVAALIGLLPLGFDRRAAKTGVRFNGFYLFASFQKDRPGR